MQFDLRPNFDFFAIFDTMRVAYPVACNKSVMLKSYTAKEMYENTEK